MYESNDDHDADAEMLADPDFTTDEDYELPYNSK
jgi:hypothetical protein